MVFMKLESFFKRFDSIRDGLKDLAKSDLHIPGWNWEKIRRYALSRNLGETILEGGSCLDLEETFSIRVFSKRFQKRKGDVSVFGNYCYVPFSLMRDMTLAEKLYEKYSSYGEWKSNMSFEGKSPREEGNVK